MPEQNKYDKEHLEHLSTYEQDVDRLYRKIVQQVAAIGISISDDFTPDQLFSFEDYPTLKKRVEKLLSALQSGLSAVILNGIEAEWTLANNKNSELARLVFGDKISQMTPEQERRYFSTNDSAREAFTKRKVNGMSLSDRVWRYTEQFKDEIELALDLGIRGGLSADEMTRDLRDYLRHPDKLFRRVRDEHGQLQLSKRAAAFHPGQGVYRSSYKNARRLAATETNMAYRTADYERWQQMDFVVGIEIRLSNNHTLNGEPFVDICDKLAGRYPKDFKFTGWHPLCRCYATTVLKTDEEIAEDTRKILNGEKLDGNSVNRVNDVPANFKEWLEENAERITKAASRGTLPYFIRDNHKTSIVEYARYKNNPAYKDVDINVTSWGVKATHIGHNFDKHTGWYEMSVQKVGYNKGYRVILEDEPQDVYKKKSCDGFWDGEKFEVAGAETATPNNIRNALKHCASKPDCEVAILFFPKYYSDALFEDGIGKYMGLKRTSQYRKFKLIVCIHDGKIVKEISQAE